MGLSFLLLAVLAITALSYDHHSSGSSSHLSVESKLSKRQIALVYPVELLPPVTGPAFSGNLTRDKLTCFGNRDYPAPTIQHVLICILNLYFNLPWTKGNYRNNCYSIWGSRRVIVEAFGNIEFWRVAKLPAITHDGEVKTLNVTRWLEVFSPTSGAAHYQKEVKEIPAEPTYICARANDWHPHSVHRDRVAKESGTPFTVTFKKAFIRESDRFASMRKSLLHLLLLFALTSAWLLPYIVAMICAVYTYLHAIKKLIMIFSFSTAVVGLTPLMLIPKNRKLARLYFQYFFSRFQVEEARMLIRQKLPVFQAIYFSCSMILWGSLAVYFICSYYGIERETRNTVLKVLLGLACAWFVFSLCRSLETFMKEWIWIAMSIILAQFLESNLNPMSTDEVFFATLFISQMIKYLSHKVWKRSKKYSWLLLKMKKYFSKYLPRSFSTSSRKHSSSDLKVVTDERSPANSMDYSIDASGQRVVCSADGVAVDAFERRQLSPLKRKDSKDVPTLSRKDSKGKLSLSEDDSTVIPAKISAELSILSAEIKAMRGLNQELTSTVQSLQRDLSAVLARLVEQEGSPPKPPKPLVARSV